MKLLAPFVISSPDEAERIEAQRKRLFAESLLKCPSDPFSIALKLFGSDTGGALRAAQEWPGDLDVIAYQKELIELEGEEAFLPSKSEALRLVWKMAEGKQACSTEQLTAMKLYAEMRSFIPKVAVAPVTVQQNSVMVIRDHGSDEDWQAAAMAHQRRIKADVIASEHVSGA